MHKLIARVLSLGIFLVGLMEQFLNMCRSLPTIDCNFRTLICTKEEVKVFSCLNPHEDCSIKLTKKGGEIMYETRKKISALIYNAFEDKIANYNFRGNDLEEEAVHDMIEECADDIDDILWSVDSKIDSILEELEAEYLPSKDEEIAFFDRERERDFFRYTK